MPSSKERRRFTWSSAQPGSQGWHGRFRVFPRFRVEWHRYRHNGTRARHVLQLHFIYDERRP